MSLFKTKQMSEQENEIKRSYLRIALMLETFKSHLKDLRSETSVFL